MRDDRRHLEPDEACACACPRAPDPCRCRRPRAACRGPITWPPAMRGFTIQNCVFSRQVVARRPSPCARGTTTPERSVASATVLDQADLDVLVLDLRLAGLETLGRLEGDGDLRAPLGEARDRRRSRPPAPRSAGSARRSRGGCASLDDRVGRRLSNRPESGPRSLMCSSRRSGPRSGAGRRIRRPAS